MILLFDIWLIQSFLTKSTRAAINARDQLALARHESPVYDCEIEEEYQIWKRAGFNAMTSRRAEQPDEGRLRRIRTQACPQ